MPADNILNVARRHRARQLDERGFPVHVGGPMPTLEWEAFFGSLADQEDAANAAGMNYRADLRGIGQPPMRGPSLANFASEDAIRSQIANADIEQRKREVAAQKMHTDARQAQILGEMQQDYDRMRVEQAFAPPEAPSLVTRTPAARPGDVESVRVEPASPMSELERRLRLLPAQLRPGYEQQLAEATAKGRTADAALMKAMAEQTTAKAALTKAETEKGGPLRDLPAPFQSVIGRVLVNAPASRRKSIEEDFARVFATGNEAELKDQIRNAAIQTENVDTKNQVTGRQATLASLNDAVSILNEMQARGVPTGFFTGGVEDLMRKVGKTSNPEYVALANRLAGTLINYRRAATGVAFGEKEGAAYEKMFPNYRNDLPVNLALIQGLQREMKTYDDSYWESKLGKEGKAFVFGESEKKGNAKDPLGIR